MGLLQAWKPTVGIGTMTQLSTRRLHAANGHLVPNDSFEPCDVDKQLSVGTPSCNVDVVVLLLVLQVPSGQIRLRDIPHW